MIRGTVALPVWNSCGIVWLCLESLCRQNKPDDDWELIVFEEQHMTMVGEDYIRSYEERLRKAGCVKIKYLTSDIRHPLSQKWVKIALASEETSEYFVLCAADNYYHPWMLQDFEKYIKSAEWCIMTKGYFYDFLLDKVIRYDVRLTVGLQMAASTPKVRQFPMDEKWSGVDTWFSQRIAPTKVNIDDTDHWKHTVCTNGMNNISKGRWKYFDNVIPPFHETKTKLNEIVPGDIYKRMKEITKNYADNKAAKEEERYGYDHQKKRISIYLSGQKVVEDTGGEEEVKSTLSTMRRIGDINTGR